MPDKALLPTKGTPEGVLGHGAARFIWAAKEGLVYTIG